MSRKGAWVMSPSQVVHEALSIACLMQTALASLLTIWQKLTAKKLDRPVWPRMQGGVGRAEPQG
jgi:hypothetical protein